MEILLSGNVAQMEQQRLAYKDGLDATLLNGDWQQRIKMKETRYAFGGTR